MNVVLAAPAAVLFWIGCMVYAAVSGGEWEIVAIIGPVIVSGAAAVVIAAGIVFDLVFQLVKSRN